eukprot:COSAG02_NODE_452_length_22047_cov_20.154502_4_plen_128_part_00
MALDPTRKIERTLPSRLADQARWMPITLDAFIQSHAMSRSRQTRVRVRLAVYFLKLGQRDAAASSARKLSAELSDGPGLQSDVQGANGQLPTRIAALGTVRRLLVRSHATVAHVRNVILCQVADNSQ